MHMHAEMGAAALKGAVPGAALSPGSLSSLERAATVLSILGRKGL